MRDLAFLTEADVLCTLMSMIRIPLLSALVLVAAACGGDGASVDITGSTPEEAAEEVTDAICSLVSGCTDFDINCMSDEMGTQCEITEGDGESFDECAAELQPEIYADFLCVELTPGQEELVNTCVNKMLDRGCQTRAEVEAIVADIEAGNEPEEEPTPPECEQLDQLFDNCEG